MDSTPAPLPTATGPAPQRTRNRRDNHALRLNIPAFNQLMAARGKTLTQDIADYLGLGYATVYAAREGRPVGGTFVAAVKKVIRGTRTRRRYVLDDLFIDDEDTPDVEAAA